MSLVARLAVHDAHAAIAWYRDAFGARLVDLPVLAFDGRVGHAELAIGDSRLQVADGDPDRGTPAPTSAASSVALVLEVEDTTAALTRALAAGATKDRPVHDVDGRREAWLTDPFGHRWCLRGPVPAARSPIRHGDLGYLMWSTPDVERATRFYTAVLGWVVQPGSIPDGRRVASAPIDLGLFAAPRSTAYPCFAVGSADDAVAAVRAVGGTANDPEDAPHGRSAECVDDQGLGFVVYEPEPGDERPVFDRPGNVGRLTVEAPDPDRAHEFLHRVLGWRDGDDGAPPHDVVPGDVPVVLPTWLVDDVAAAVDRVRAAGGTADAPDEDASVACTDDQGGRFRLAPVP